jgi:methionyl-tRNA synthetase
MSAASREALWVAKLADKFGIPAKPFRIRADSLGAVQAVTKYTYTKHSKHITIHQDFMRDMYQQGYLSFEHIRGADNPADLFTKALPLKTFIKHRGAIGMRELSQQSR